MPTGLIKHRRKIAYADTDWNIVVHNESKVLAAKWVMITEISEKCKFLKRYVSFFSERTKIIFSLNLEPRHSLGQSARQRYP
jgi:hypothetical protein